MKKLLTLSILFTQPAIALPVFRTIDCQDSISFVFGWPVPTLKDGAHPIQVEGIEVPERVAHVKRLSEGGVHVSLTTTFCGIGITVRNQAVETATMQCEQSAPTPLECVLR